MDLGDCPKVHSAVLKAEYEEARKKKDYGYSRELERFIEQLISECDRKITRARKRLEDVSDAPQDEELKNEIKRLYEKAEELGAAGDIDESLQLMKQAEELKTQKSLPQVKKKKKKKTSLLSYFLSNMLTTLSTLQTADPLESIPTGPTSQQQKLRVCDVCGAFLSIYDSNRRLADHFGGKLHMGYKTIREKLQELKEQREAEKGERSESSGGRGRDERSSRESGEDGGGGYDEPRGHRRERSRDRYRSDHRDHNRDYRRSHRDSRGGDYRDSKDRHYRDRDRG
jgi:RNA-binding protein Luc7-like 2